MVDSPPAGTIAADILHNCHISDARDHGIYSMCTMVLKLRNLYKWEHGLEPWHEAEPADLLDWIDAKEDYWQTIATEEYRPLGMNGVRFLPDNVRGVNLVLQDSGMVYGAGYGRAMKAVFFLAEKLEERRVHDIPVLILGRETAREMASPFAMAQEGTIYIRREALRYFLWDQIQELRSSCRQPFRHALRLYGLLQDDRLDQARCRAMLDTIVDEELDLFIHHEVGEILQETLDSALLRRIIGEFPSTVIELVCRTVKDVLADTHPHGPLAHAVATRRQTTLALHMGFLDGLRRNLSAEVAGAWEAFMDSRDWSVIEEARQKCRSRNLALAETIAAISARIGSDPRDYVQELFNSRVIAPLGLDLPQ